MSITFEFVGGFMDGRTVSSDSPDPLEAKWAEAYYFLTDSGKVGKRFKSLSDAALHSLQSGNLPDQGFVGHIYEVIEQRDNQGQVVVRAKYTGSSQ